MNELDGKYVRRSLDMTFDENKEEKKNIIEGLAAVYNSRADIGCWFHEIIAPGAFDRADMSDVALYLNHDITKLPLARCRKNSSLNSLQVWADADGLRMRTELDTENNTDARALCSAIERGDVDGMSFVFVVDSEEWSDLNSEMPLRTITGIKKVVEVSAVTYPAYDDTTIGFARAKKAQESDLAALERAKAEKENRENAEFVNLQMMKEKILMM